MAARKKIGLIGAGNIGGTLALLAAQKQLGDVVLYDIEKALGMTKGKALDINQLRAVDGYEVMLSGTSDFKELAGCDVTIIT
ncbi:MAG: lactate/malate family dehydrogenase, partial [Myxococcales bacterium]